MLNDVLPKYFQEDASNFEKNWIIYNGWYGRILGTRIIGTNMADISKTLKTICCSSCLWYKTRCIIWFRRIYKRTNVDYNKYTENILAILYKGIETNSDREKNDEYQSAPDNIVQAVGKLIKNNGNEYTNLKQIIEKWLSNLPIKGDISESVKQHDLLDYIVMQSPDMIFRDNNSNYLKLLELYVKFMIQNIQIKK